MSNSKRNCPDCDRAVGELHMGGCDTETCPECGCQRLGCDCETDLPSIPWAGERVDYLAAEEYGFYAYWDPSGAGIPSQNYGWVSVDKDHPRANPDMNRVYRACTWDKEKQKWIKK